MHLSKEDIPRLFESILGKISVIEPIGNHQLKRHLVYKIIKDNIPYALKLYYKPDRWNREIASLKLIEKTQIQAPLIKQYGKLDDGTEWLLMEWVEGELLLDTQKHISKDNLRDIYFHLGQQMGLLHTFKTFDFFGSMTVDGKSLHHIKNYSLAMKKRLKTIVEAVYTYEHDELALIKEAEAQLKTMFCRLNEVKQASLCHSDFGPRNIMVRKHDDVYKLAAIIDFERCTPSDPDKELIYNYLPLLESEPYLACAFKRGYEKYRLINQDSLLKKKDFYMLFEGLLICSWAKNVAYDYYLEGVNNLKTTLKKYRTK